MQRGAGCLQTWAESPSSAGGAGLSLQPEVPGRALQVMCPASLGEGRPMQGAFGPGVDLAGPGCLTCKAETVTAPTAGQRNGWGALQ